MKNPGYIVLALFIFPCRSVMRTALQACRPWVIWIMQDQAQQRIGRRMESGGMQNGMNSSMGAR